MGHRSTRHLAGALALLAALLPVTALPGAAAGPGTERVSVSSGGGQGSAPSAGPAISADGRYVAFTTAAPELVAGDTNASQDVFLRDRQTGTTTRVSVATGGGEANNDSDQLAISSDARYVAFDSGASNLVAGDTNGRGDIFVRDRQMGTTTRVSVATGGGESDSDSFNPALSADGRYVAFESVATNLVAGDTNASQDVFVHDRQTGTTSRVSVATGGGEADDDSHSPVLSADGRHVAFASTATDLVADDTNARADVFVHDRQMGTTSRVSVATGGGEADNGSMTPSISADGRYVAFYSAASNLVAGDTNGRADVFVRDRQTGTTSRVSVATGGGESDDASFAPAISPDGRYVAFESDATNLVAGDTNGLTDVFLHDRQTVTTTRVSLRSGGGQASGTSWSASISEDARYVAFASTATDLVTGDTNAETDIFVRDRTGDPQPAPSPAPTPSPIPAEGYRVAGADGGVFAFGATFEGSAGGLGLTSAVVDIATTSSDEGYWLVAADGGVFAFGDARFYGSTGGLHLASPVVGMAATPTGRGYWLVAADGGVFAFGDARFYGSTGGLRLASPVVGMAATPTGQGYWLVAADGGVFAFGDARFHGSTGALALDAPVVGIAATPTGRGYWLVAADGGVFAFGDATFAGSTGALALDAPVVGIKATPTGRGYHLAAADGGVFAFGDARFYGSAAALGVTEPIVGLG